MICTMTCVNLYIQITTVTTSQPVGTGLQRDGVSTVQTSA